MLLTDNIRTIKNIGEQRANKLNGLGVYTVGDLVEYFPRDYDDRSDVKSIAQLVSGENNNFKAVIYNTPEVVRVKNVTITKAKAVDETGSVEIVWFNQPYLKNSLQLKNEYLFTGKAVEKYGRIQVESPDMELLRDDRENLSTGRIVPIYPSTKNLSQKVLRALIKDTLGLVYNQLTEFLPIDTRKENKLCDRNFAIENIHFPENDESFFIARRRLVFEELFLLQMRLLQLKGNIQSKKSNIKIKSIDTKPIRDMLGFELTDAQENVLNEIINDIKNNNVMNRLVQGDVGSGKTALIMISAYIMINNGYQAVLMAPTDVLANQHYKSFCDVFGKLGIKCVMLTSGVKRKEKLACYEEIENGQAQMIIGTHAVIQESVNYNNLGLVVTDEQHRFGVRQRAILTAKGENPHVLVMTATPIPRTLALILYGDLDISIIDRLPPGRQKIDTVAVNSGYYDRLYTFIRKEVKKGRQTYIICPMIEESDKQELKAVTAYTEKLQSEVFSDLNVECIHGKMKNDIKQDIMNRFANGDIDILVSTTVIEVGINVPNATVMVIENAERFGLSALHQLRGRVGRGSEKSYCVLVSDAKNKIAKERLKVMCSSADCFEISDKDLELRGPGDFFGTRQHGLPELKIANLYKDIAILQEVQKSAIKLYREDETLKKVANKCLNDKIKEIFIEKDEKVCL